MFRTKTNYIKKNNPKNLLQSKVYVNINLFLCGTEILKRRDSRNVHQTMQILLSSALSTGWIDSINVGLLVFTSLVGSASPMDVLILCQWFWSVYVLSVTPRCKYCKCVQPSMCELPLKLQITHIGCNVCVLFR